MAKAINTIVIGGLHTDIIAAGVNRILGNGEYTKGKELVIGPGGKSRNIAQMIAALSGKDTVAMVGKTSIDPFHLWKPPINALNEAGVNIEYVQQIPYEETNKMPAIAMIPVDIGGNNQIYVLPGINEDFSPKDIDDASSLFDTVKVNDGIFVLTLEQPLETAIYAVKKANDYGLRVFLDPGGIEENTDYSELLKQKIFLCKPNEHEAKILTGITIVDLSSAEKAGRLLLQKGIRNVFITHGKKGGYLINETLAKHIPVPNVFNASIKDETGCGDQTMAAICYSLTNNADVLHAVSIGILAGSLQFAKQGIVPITKKELESHMKTSLENDK